MTGQPTVRADAGYTRRDIIGTAVRARGASGDDMIKLDLVGTRQLASLKAGRSRVCA